MLHLRLVVALCTVPCWPIYEGDVDAERITLAGGQLRSVLEDAGSPGRRTSRGSILW
jgi:hypothetical protein